MAYNIFWKIQFKSLRAGTVYTVNIYKDGTLPSGYPKYLKGAAQPFVTQEDNDDDFFKFVRTQTGYIRIVDDGKDASGDSLGSGWWKSMIPSTDTDRPVTLTDSSNNVLWQGFMQTQNFSGKLYENVQEREFPIQCAMMTLSRVDVSTSAFNGVKNFASLIDYALNSVSALSFTNLYIQGGADARRWLLKQIDWMVFGELDEDGIYDSKHSILEAIEGICKYWGWTLRTSGQNIFMTCVDDTTSVNFLSLTRAQLTTLAGGTSTGSIDYNGYSSASIGDVFADNNNNDVQVRGCNKAIVTSESGDIDENIVYAFPESFMMEMANTGFSPGTGQNPDYYTSDKTSFETELLLGYTYASSYATFNIKRYAGDPPEYSAVVRLKTGYSADISVATFESKKIHDYCDGKFILKGNVDSVYAQQTLNVIVGVGLTRSSALWYHPNSQGVLGWYSNMEECPITIGEGGEIELKMDTSQLSSPLYGYLYVQIKGLTGSDTSLSYTGDIKNFQCSFERNVLPYKWNPARVPTNKYSAKNDAVIHSDWSGDSIFSTDNNSKFGPGVVLNDDKTYFTGWNYATHSETANLVQKQPGYHTINLGDATTPEQHLANRVAKFWSQSRRKMELDLLSNQVANITPRYKVTIDSMTFYPYSIGREWRDDILILNILEI